MCVCVCLTVCHCVCVCVCLCVCVCVCVCASSEGILIASSMWMVFVCWCKLFVCLMCVCVCVCMCTIHRIGSTSRRCVIITHTYYQSKVRSNTKCHTENVCVCVCSIILSKFIRIWITWWWMMQCVVSAIKHTHTTRETIIIINKT